MVRCAEYVGMLLKLRALCKNGVFRKPHMTCASQPLLAEASTLEFDSAGMPIGEICGIAFARDDGFRSPDGPDR